MILKKCVAILLFSFVLSACGEGDKPEPQKQDQSAQPDMDKVKESRDKMFKQISINFQGEIMAITIFDDAFTKMDDTIINILGTQTGALINIKHRYIICISN